MLGVVIATFQLQNSLCGLLEQHCRHPVSANYKIPALMGYGLDEEYVLEVTLQAVPVALQIEDEELTAMHEASKTGNWRQTLKAYELVCNESTYIGQAVLRGMRIMVPKKLQRRVLDLIWPRRVIKEL